MNKKKVGGWIMVGVGSWLCINIGLNWLFNGDYQAVFTQAFLPALLLFFGVNLIQRSKRATLMKSGG